MGHNCEIQYSFFRVALLSQEYFPSIKKAAMEFTTKQGRMKYTRPMFRELAKHDKEWALKCFEKKADFFHPICRAMVEKDFGVSDGRSERSSGQRRKGSRGGTSQYWWAYAAAASAVAVGFVYYLRKK